MNQKKMQQNKIKEIKGISFLLTSVALVTTFFKTDFYDPFNSAKLILLLILAGYLIGHLFSSYRSKPIRFRSIEFFVTTVISVFIISLLISTILTSSFIVGFIGETQRRNGFLSYLGLAIVLLYTSRSFDFSNIDKIFKVGVLVGITLSTYGLLQINGKDFIAWDNPYNAMISTLGNPNFASSMLAVLILLSLYGSVLKNFSLPFKLLSLYLIGSGIIAIIGSQSWQGLLVIFFSLIFYLSILSFIKNKWLGVLVTLTSISAGVTAVFGMLQKGPLASILYKDSLSVRGYYWRAGLEMFKEYPLTGIGVDRYGAYFKAFREVGYPLKYGYQITSSNAHNTFIQLFATSGLVVGISYLVLMFTILVAGLSLIKQSSLEHKKIILGLLSTWVGFQAQSLISIDNIGISIWGWLIGGTILALKFRFDDKLSINKRHENETTKLNKVQINLFQPLISVFALIPILIFSFNFYKVEHNLFILKSISNPAFVENKQPVLTYVNSVFESKLVDPFYKYRCAFFLYDMGFKSEAYEILSDLVKKDPANPDFLSGKVFIEESRNNIAGVIFSREQIVKVDPWNAENYLELMKLYLAQNDLAKAKKMQAKILEFAPGTEIAKKSLEVLS